MIRLTLFDKPECPFCWKIRFALFFKGLEYLEHYVDTDNKPAELLAASPKGTVPVLITPQGVLDESPVIMAWIEQQHPQPPLLHPPKARELEYFSDKVVGVRIRDQIFMRRGSPPSEWDPNITARCQKDWAVTLGELEGCCSDTGPWFLGEAPSVADCALGARFSLAAFYGLTGLEHYPKLQRWFTRLIATEAWQRATPDTIRVALAQTA